MRLSIILTLLMSGLVTANVVQAGSLRVPVDIDRDVFQTILARKLLQDDPDLMAWNIGVTVQDRVLVLWGPVPSAEVLFRAELCVKTMPGLAGVRNELFVCEPIEGVKTPLRIQLPPTHLPDRLPPKLPPESRAPAGAPGVLAKQEIPMTTTEKPAKQPNATPASAKPSRPSDTPTLGAPLPDARPALADAVHATLQSQPTFRSIEFAVSEGHVYLRGSDPGALIEAAQRIARLPGVAGVVINEREK